MERIVVASVSMVPELLQRYQTDAMLSIAAKPKINESVRPKRHLECSFADIDEPSPRNLDLAAKPADINMIRSLASAERILIHCNKGQRRSPAAALILAQTLNYSPTVIAELIWSVAGYVDFNLHMLKLAGIERSLLGPPRPFLTPPLGAYFVLDLKNLS
ncbi:hypothetical protein U5801_27790 [Lamprobacter modestohalophilus]|uniref:hypothetical protein n=1 Tax=Lamprobacter modestohalophilus TaxID=1064514 RepID=UPI002ADECF06|nr:hypothetical protein [Lamprobacter modestohalophilus]MEA1053579.1 hypothetical protein [Lamprobacter modestohalophilus]